MTPIPMMELNRWAKPDRERAQRRASVFTDHGYDGFSCIAVIASATLGSASPATWSMLDRTGAVLLNGNSYARWDEEERIVHLAGFWPL